MSEPQIGTLVQAVHDLNGQVAQNAAALKAGQQHADHLARSNRRHRAVLILTIIGLVVDTLLTVVIIAAHVQLGCTERDLQARQGYNERDFNAESAKVSGQLRGVDMLDSNPHAGIAQFRAASQQYLDRIAAIHKDQLAHPAGRC